MKLASKSSSKKSGHIEAKVRGDVRAGVDVELADLRAVSTERERKVKELQQTELQLRKEKRELEEQKQAVEAQVEEKVRRRVAEERQGARGASVRTRRHSRCARTSSRS